ncbi:hypothetical protein TWF132_001507 [Orbilia oligospora]|nr:hypothetical protein TWF132_001507 [Orbilia oligospora]
MASVQIRILCTTVQSANSLTPQLCRYPCPESQGKDFCRIGRISIGGYCATLMPAHTYLGRYRSTGAALDSCPPIIGPDVT